MSISLNSERLFKLNRLILENLRVKQGRVPIYVDIASNVAQILARQSHVVFGRRGSGKSTLLLTAKTMAEQQGFLCIYFDSELIKENPFPDVLISLMIKIFENLFEYYGAKDKNIKNRVLYIFKIKKDTFKEEVKAVIGELKKLRTEPQIYDIERKTIISEEKKKGLEARVSLERAEIGGRLDKAEVSSVEETTEITRIKVNKLQQNLEIYHDKLENLLKKIDRDMMLFLDDFYFIAKQDQPQVIDYLHRLSKGTKMYLKLGTIRYRTSLYRVSSKNGKTTGVELNNDIFPIELDYTLEDFKVMSNFLDQVLIKFAEGLNIEINDLDGLFTEGGKKLLHLASGGVPRDFLNLFLKSQSIARSLMLKKMEKQRVVGEAARQYLTETKWPNLSEDTVGDVFILENLIQRIRRFSINEKRKTVFLVNQEEKSQNSEEYDRLKQLMDLRFIHLVDSHTSATYGRRGRYEGYIVDSGFWASPRIPGLVEVDFNKRDASGRKDELRNCPIFKLK